MSEWTEYADRLTKQARQAAKQLSIANGAQKQRWLHRSAELLMTRADELMPSTSLP